MSRIIPWCDESLEALRDEMTGKSQQIRCTVVRSVIDEALIYRKANEFARIDGRYLFARSVDSVTRTSRAEFHLRGAAGALVEVARYCPRAFEDGWVASLGTESIGSYSTEVGAMDALWERLAHDPEATQGGPKDLQVLSAAKRVAVKGTPHFAAALAQIHLSFPGDYERFVRGEGLSRSSAYRLSQIGKVLIEHFAADDGSLPPGVASSSLAAFNLLRGVASPRVFEAARAITRDRSITVADVRRLIDEENAATS
jgi:hypothetical protein